MNQREIFDLIQKNNHFVFRNNRGAGFINGSFVKFGIPEPKLHEGDDMLKGGDYIGFEVVEITPEMIGKKIAVFKSIEAKTAKDKLKSGQIRWHNLILDYGGLSEIYFEDKIVKDKL